MKEFTYVIQDKNGMHARPAGALANCAKKYKSDIKIYKNAILDSNSINDSLNIIEQQTNSNLNCLDNISILVKEKKNEK